MRQEDVIDLNELNVKKFLKYCKSRPEDDETDLAPVYAYVDEDGNIDPRTKLFFSKKRYEEQREHIASMLGQIKKVHETGGLGGKETHLLDLIDLSTKYDGTRWTADPNCTLFLFWLGNAGKYFTGLKKDENGIYRTDLWDAIKRIIPMESPSDPNLVKRFSEKEKQADDFKPEEAQEIFGEMPYMEAECIAFSINTAVFAAKSHLYTSEETLDKLFNTLPSPEGYLDLDSFKKLALQEKVSFLANCASYFRGMKSSYGRQLVGIGIMYLKGEKVDHNFDMAMDLFEKSADEKTAEHEFDKLLKEELLNLFR